MDAANNWYHVLRAMETEISFSVIELANEILKLNYHVDTCTTLGPVELTYKRNNNGG